VKLGTYYVNEFEYVKRLTRKEAEAGKRHAETGDEDDSEDSGSDGGFKENGGEFTESDEEPSVEL
jgi:hypothetical protein